MRRISYALAIVLTVVVASACGSSAGDKTPVDTASPEDTTLSDDVVADSGVDDTGLLPDGAADVPPPDTAKPQDVAPADVAVEDLSTQEVAAEDLAADTGEEVPCGDPEIMAKYGECNGAEDKETCEEAGGNWAIIGLAPFEECQCPTGQGGCKCTHLDDCIGACTADFQEGEMWNCEGLTHGYCSPYAITVGCWCFFWEEGQPEGICAD
jgi:hypothetical protein